LLQPFTPPFALATLLVSLTATAQAATAGRSAPRSVVLTGKAGEAPLLYLAPGTFTFIILDAPIIRESVEVEGRARFARVDPANEGIMLEPAVPLAPGERLALRFTYREGFPASVVLLLTGQPGTVDEVVTLRRPLQTVEACRVELATTHERCEAQARELQALKAQPPGVSPATVALAGLVDEGGMEAADFKRECFQATGGPRPVRCKGLGAATWSVVVLEVSNTGEPWMPTWAEVMPAEGGESRRAHTVLSIQATSTPGGAVSVAVEVEMPKRKRNEWLKVPHSLRVCNEDGSRCLSVPGVKL